MQQNKHAVIATAAPEWLALTLMDSLQITFQIVGTPLKNKSAAWIGVTHCRYQEYAQAQMNGRVISADTLGERLLDIRGI